MNETLNYYNKNAKQFINDTINVDFEDKQKMFLKYLNNGAHILDLGCGSGRDSKSFIEKGFKVTAIDGSIELCKLASEYIKEQVQCIKFENIDYQNEFDGIWACASILHVPLHNFKDILKNISRALKENGYFYASFKYGDFEGVKNGRYFTYFTERSFRDIIKNLSELMIIEMQITSDARIGREAEKWLNVILKKQCKNNI